MDRKLKWMNLYKKNFCILLGKKISKKIERNYKKKRSPIDIG